MVLLAPLLVGAKLFVATGIVAALPAVVWKGALPMAAKITIMTAMAMQLYDWTISRDREMTILEGLGIFGGVLVYRQVR